MGKPWSGISSHAAQVAEPTIPIDTGDSVPDGNGRCSKHQVLSCLVTDDAGNIWMIPYSHMMFQCVSRNGPGTFTVRLTDVDEDTYDLILTGNSRNLDGLLRIIDHLATGKREVLRPHAETIPSITFKKLV